MPSYFLFQGEQAVQASSFGPVTPVYLHPPPKNPRGARTRLPTLAGRETQTARTGQFLFAYARGWRNHTEDPTRPSACHIGEMHRFVADSSSSLIVPVTEHHRLGLVGSLPVATRVSDLNLCSRLTN